MTQADDRSSKVNSVPFDHENERAARARENHPYLNTPQAAHYLGVHPRTVANMRKRGEGPLYRRHGRYVKYHVDDLIAWSDGQISRQTPDV